MSPSSPLVDRALHAVAGRADAKRPDVGAPRVISGEEFRRDYLGWSKDKFYALVKSGRIAHLISLNASTAARTFYVREKVEAWIRVTPEPRLAKRA